MIDIGKQFPLPSVNLSSLKGSCSLWTVSMISLAILPSTWSVSSAFVQKSAGLAPPGVNFSQYDKTVEISICDN